MSPEELMRDQNSINYSQLRLLVPKLEYSRLIKCIPRLLMPWWHKEPAHQQPWHLIYSITWFMSYTGNVLTTCTISVLRNANIFHVKSIDVCTSATDTVLNLFSDIHVFGTRMSYPWAMMSQQKHGDGESIGYQWFQQPYSLQFQIACSQNALPKYTISQL